MVDFENLPSTKTPLNAENLNKIQFDKIGEEIADCNDKNLDSGIYYTGASTLNKPTEQSGSAGFLVTIKKQWNVDNSNATITQYWLRYRDGQVYKRQCSSVTNNEFTEWIEISQNDSGWKDLNLTSAFKKTNNATQTPVYRKVGKMVQVTGAVTPTAEITASQTTKIATLPVGFRPSHDVNVLCQGSGMNKWLVAIQPSGAVNVERYGTTSNSAIPLNAWLPFNVTFFVD